MGLMTRLGLGLLGGSEGGVGGGQAWCGGEEGTVIWIVVVMMLDLGLPGEGGVVVEGCPVSHREEEERVMTVRMTMMMLLGLGVLTECSNEVAGEVEGQRVLDRIEAGAGGIWVCCGGVGGIVIWIMMMMVTLDLDPRGEDVVAVERCLVCRREEGGKVIWMTMRMTMLLGLVIPVVGD